MAKMEAKEEERESWGNHCEFFLTSLGLAVGLGNVWRFPYVTYVNGGGTFLVPYTLMLVLVGCPALFVEMSLGQYGRAGASKLYGRMVPLFKGLGYGMTLVRMMANIYYVVIMAWAFFYLFAGFRSDLPWADCEQEWNTDDCYTIGYAKQCQKKAGPDQYDTYWKGECVSRGDYCTGHEYPGGYVASSDSCQTADGAETSFKSVVESNSISPAEDYFNGYVLGLTKNNKGERYDWNDFGQMQWKLVVCLLVSWALICLTMIKGIASLGKASYVITLSPYFILTALLIYAAQLPGASNGISYYLTPEWEKLWNVDIWSQAASQILFSLSVGFGSQLILASYNDFRNNSHRDAILISLCNSLTSVYAGFVVFCILGFIEHQTQSSIDKVVQGGISLAFVSYPTAVVEMDVSPLWSFLFFFMLINLALSSICGGFQTFTVFLLDELPKLKQHKTKVVVGLSLFFFLAGLPMCMGGGIHLFTVFDKRCTSSLLPIVFVELAMLSWFYGQGRFFDNLTDMGMRLTGILRLVWRGLLGAVAPLFLGVVAVLSWINHTDMDFDNYVYPSAVQAAGWAMELVPVAIVFAFPVIMIYSFWSEGYKGSDLWRRLVEPTPKWFTTDRGTGETGPKAAVSTSKEGEHNQGYE